jgi:hypothetical protein
MISSTLLDLPEHRNWVIDAVFRCECFPMVMEKDAASSEDAIRYSLQLVDQSDVFIGVIGFRYGTVREGQTESISVLEYRRALEREMPIFYFIMSDDHPVVASGVETDPEKRRKLEEFKREVEERHVPAFFSSPMDLAYKALDTLHKWKEEQPTTRRSATTSVATAPLTPMPHPPEPYIAHRYTPSHLLVGRAEELTQLDRWYQSPHAALVVEAIGGVGKSALTWDWLRSRRATLLTDAEGTIWWSFYETDASVERFVEQALLYFGEASPEHIRAQDGRQQIEALLALLQRRRALIVLDGIERILTAYGGLGAAHLSDAQVEDDLRASRTDLRRCLDPRHGDFLRRLCTTEQSKVLMTTRLIPAELSHHATHQLLPEIDSIALGGLQPHDALELMRHLGVRGNHEQQTVFMSRFGFHSLLIGLLAGRIVNFRPAPGDFDAWLTAEGQSFSAADIDLKQRRHHILAYAFEGLDATARKLLCYISVFRYPVDYAALDLFDRTGGIASHLPGHHDSAAQAANRATAAARLDMALADLENRGLLQWDRQTNRYDLHPVVRSFAFAQLEDADRKQSYENVRAYFGRLPEERLQVVRSVDELRRTLEIYNALVGAQRYTDAWSLYRDRLRAPLLTQLGAYADAYQLLAALWDEPGSDFMRGLHFMRRLADAQARKACGIDLAIALEQMSDTPRALQVTEDLVRDALPLFTTTITATQAADISHALMNYASMLADANHIARAERLYHWALAFGRDTSNDAVQADTLVQLLRFYTLCGNWPGAEKAYGEFSARFARVLLAADRRTGDAYRHRAHMLIMQGINADEMLESAWRYAQQWGDILDRRSTLYLRAMNHAQEAMRLGADASTAPPSAQQRLASAEQDILQAIELAQRSSMRVGSYLAQLAMIRTLTQRSAEARSLTTEAIAYGARPLVIAELYGMLDDRPSALPYALEAYTLAWADGPPYCRRWELDRAEDLIRSCHGERPNLPAFDPSVLEMTELEREVAVKMSQSPLINWW